MLAPLVRRTKAGLGIRGRGFDRYKSWAAVPHPVGAGGRTARVGAVRAAPLKPYGGGRRGHQWKSIAWHVSACLTVRVSPEAERACALSWIEILFARSVVWCLLPSWADVTVCLSVRVSNSDPRTSTNILMRVFTSRGFLSNSVLVWSERLSCPGLIFRNFRLSPRGAWTVRYTINAKSNRLRDGLQLRAKNSESHRGCVTACNCAVATTRRRRRDIYIRVRCFLSLQLSAAHR